MAENTQTSAPVSKQSQGLTGKERFENGWNRRKSTVETNPDAIVFVPESPVARALINALMTFDSLDGLMRSQAGLNVSYEEFGHHIKAFQELSETMEKSNRDILALIANNEKIEPRSIRNRYTRKEVEALRKKIKQESTAKAPTELVPVDAKNKEKEKEPEAPKK
ncbi:MAG: hypothetical protein WCW84_13585 [Sulfurimonas sp.]|jgi:hypothetical protein